MRAPAVALVAALLTGARCEAPLAPHAAPASARATVVIEPPVLALGDAAVVEVAVVTPPGWSVPAVPAPAEIPGLSVFEVERPLLEKEPSRWLHRTRFHVRVRSTGALTWPGASVVATDGAGRAVEVELPARPFEVRALLADTDAASPPFAYRAPAPASRGGLSPWLAALAGAGASLAAVAAVALLRQRRGAARAAQAPAAARARPVAPELFTEALAWCERDAAHASDLASLALRGWLDRRYHTALLTTTTQELAASPPPVALAYRWAELLALLEGLDAVRLRPGGAARANELRALLARARALVLAMAPAEPAA